MTYTITADTIKKLAAAREYQAAVCFKQHTDADGFPNPDFPGLNRDWANVAFVNGSTFQVALPIGKVAKWVNLLDVHQPEISVEISDTKIILQCGNSSLLLNRLDQAPEECRLLNGIRQSSTPRDWLGAPIKVTAPQQGGFFDLEFEAGQLADLKSIKASNSAAKKAARHARLVAQARSEERTARHALAEAARSHVANLAILATPLADALARARTVRAMHAERRSMLANFTTAPAWLPEFQDAGLNPDFFSAEYIEAANHPRQTFAGYLSAYQAAKLALDTYQPPMRWPEYVLTRARWYQTKPEAWAKAENARMGVEYYKRYPVHGPKYHELAKGVSSNGRNLTTMLEAAWRCECARRGYPEASGKAYSFQVSAYREARREARQWPDAKARLAGRYLAARQNRIHLETI